VVALPVPKPGPGEALCRIGSVAICGSDAKMIHGHYRDVHWPPFFPFVMGHEWAGEVVAIGEGVTEVSVGDRVAGEAHSGCGKCKNCLSGHYTVCLNYGKDGHDGGADKGHRHYGFFWQGANAEYNAYKVQSLHKFADHLSFDEAALCDTAGVAMHGIDLIGITPGGTTVVFGPGPIGLCAMQIAKGMGAGRTIMIGRGAKLEIARELGADVCIDFEREDPVARVLELTGGVGCDEVIECSGADDSPKKACELVKKTGSVVLTANYREDLSQIPLPGAGGRAAGAARAGPPRRLRDQPDPLEKGARTALRGARAVGGAAPDRGARTRDRGVRAGRVLDHHRGAGQAHPRPRDLSRPALAH